MNSTLSNWLQAQLTRVANNKTRSVLNFYGHGNEVGDEGVKALAALLPGNDKIKILILTSAKIGPEGAIALARGLTENRSVQTVYLDGNHIGDAGAMAFAKMLQISKSMKELYLDNNSIHSTGGKALAMACEKNCTLELISLAGNSIGNKGAQAFGDMLKRNRGLKDLNLAAISTEENGMRGLLDGLEANKSLERFNVSQNCIGNGGVKAIGSMLKRNQGLRCLYLWHIRQIDEESKKAFVEGVQNNFFLERVYFLKRTDEALVQEIKEALKLNSAGRRLLRADDAPTTLWTRVLAKNEGDPSTVFYFLRAKPDLFLNHRL